MCEQVITVLNKWQVISQQKIYKCLDCLPLYQFISQFPTQISETLQNWIFNPIATPGFILCVQWFEVRGIIVPSVYIIGGIVDHKYCLKFLFIITLPALAAAITWSSSEKEVIKAYTM